MATTAWPVLSDMSSGIVGWVAAALVLARSGCLASTGVVELGRGALGAAVLASRAKGSSERRPPSLAAGEKQVFPGASARVLCRSMHVGIRQIVAAFDWPGDPALAARTLLSRSGSACFSNGLDPAGMLQLRHLIRELVNEAQTVLLSSHQFDEVQKICSV
jgi:hypothetical protein